MSVIVLLYVARQGVSLTFVAVLIASLHFRAPPLELLQATVTARSALEGSDYEACSSWCLFVAPPLDSSCKLQPAPDPNVSPIPVQRLETLGDAFLKFAVCCCHATLPACLLPSAA
jgi:hypothetical protein